LLLASTIPNCKSYDPAFAGELAVILDHGAREMLEERKDVFYYVTVMNENYEHPNLPPDAHAGVIQGMYRFAQHRPAALSTAFICWARGPYCERSSRRPNAWRPDWRVASDVWSVTSFSELAREAREVERFNRLMRGETPRQAI